jgi:Ca-activated chloride channel family protein
MTVRATLFVCAVLACSGFLCPSGNAAEQEAKLAVRAHKAETASSGRVPSIRADVSLILVPVSVTDASDRPITVLPKESFRLLEDGVEQSIVSFSREEAPVSMGLLFDTSGSMKNRLAASMEAIRYVFQTTMRGDEFFVVQFADQAKALGGFTPAPDEIQRRLGLVEAKGWTALLDALALGTNQMKRAKNRRRVLLVLSDGNDNNSRFSETEIRNMVVEADVRVYAVALGYRPRVLRQLADETGGKVLVAQNMAELPDVVQRLSAEIRSQYLLGYSSNNPNNDGKYRKVRVEVVGPTGLPHLNTTWRRGYYAPSE